jgi:cytochrome c oxidase subunit 2
VLLLAGCSSNGQSTLHPSGPGSQTSFTSWWILFGVATFVCVLVITAAILALVVRRRAKKVDEGEGRRFVMTFGVILPAIVFAATFALSVVGISRNSEPDARPAATIDVIGHQWWWEVRYTGTGGSAGNDTAVTANEIHVPVGTPVQIRLRSADVIHSFWVPELMPKTDLFPGRVNTTWLTADHAGTYRGQCAEFCGLQHGHMAFEVVAQSKSDYEDWLAGQAADARKPTTSEEMRGESVLTTTSCATCHTVRGTDAQGDVGPDLTHVGSRDRLGAGAIPNDSGHMAGWVANSQTVKPGNIMPPQRLSPDDLRAVVAYLQSLE